MNYLEIIRNVLKNGVPKQATRLDNKGNVIPVENGTIGTFCEIFRHDMSQGFPLTTLRKMPWQSVRVELEGFIKGITDKKWYQERKCKFWDSWANIKSLPSYMTNIAITKEKLNIERLESNDLGPVYGYQWRNFGQQYGEVDSKDYIEGGCCPATGEYQQIHTNINGIGYFGEEKGFDQLQSIVDKLKSNPYDRRMVCSAWNPNQMDMMALPSCHYAWNVVVYGNKLNLVFHMRSADLLLGVGANIASYALLLLLLCEESGLEPGELVGTLADCHIYENHLDAGIELSKREENLLPNVNIKRKEDGTFSIFDWTYNQVELIGYNPHEKLEIGSVTV